MNGLLPVGAVIPFAGQVDPVSGPRNDIWESRPCAPTNAQPATPADAPLNRLEAQGFMLCDGRWLGKAAYPELFAVLGHLYGTKDSGASFRIPDYRGLFLRGFDGGAGMDPDAATRIAPTGTSVGNSVGSLQCDALQEHTHNYDIIQPAAISQQGQAAGATSTSRATTAPNPPARLSAETRPKNIAVSYVIKFR